MRDKGIVALSFSLLIGLLYPLEALALKVQWLGHASFLITASDGTKIVTDPYEPGAFEGAIGYKKITA